LQRNSGMSPAMLNTELELRRRLVDQFSDKLLTGALQVVPNEGNPIRLSQFAAAMRELFSYTLQTLAPDDEVKNCDWFELHPNTKGPTRKQRAKYATQGGLSDKYIAEIGIDVNDLHDEAIAALDEMSKFTHIRPGTMVEDQTEIDKFVYDAMSALLNLFSSFEDCRATVIDALSHEIDAEAVSALVGETLADVDILATHHFIKAVEIGDVSISAITSAMVRINVAGSLGVELQWGSGSDVARGDGATLNETFPFEVLMEAPVRDVRQLRSLDYSVNTDSWYE
jgi:hypothetical protein